MEKSKFPGGMRPQRLCGLTCGPDAKSLMMSRAWASEMNHYSFRHSSRNLPLSSRYSRSAWAGRA